MRILLLILMLLTGLVMAAMATVFVLSETKLRDIAYDPPFDPVMLAGV